MKRRHVWIWAPRSGLDSGGGQLRWPQRGSGCESHEWFHQQASVCVRSARSATGSERRSATRLSYYAATAAPELVCLRAALTQDGRDVRRHFVKCKSSPVFLPCLHHRSTEWPPQAQRQQMSRRSQIPTPPTPLCFFTPQLFSNRQRAGEESRVIRTIYIFPPTSSRVRLCSFCFRDMNDCDV